MRRASVLLALCAMIPSPAVAQDQQPVFLYESLYRVGYGDMEAWNRVYHEYAVPILTDMRDAGKIEGWSQWQHHTGGAYNIRFTVRTYEWGEMDAFWSEYLQRMDEAVPESEAAPDMIRAHTDQIWNIETVNTRPGTSNFLYESTFRFPMGRTAEWNRIWREVTGPILEEAMDQGLLNGFVKLNHNAGGPYNSKVLYLFEEWDDIDDMFAYLLEQMPARFPEDAAAAFDLFLEHDDVIWVPTPAGDDSP